VQREGLVGELLPPSIAPVNLSSRASETGATLLIYHEQEYGRFERWLRLDGLGFDLHLECPQPRDSSFSRTAPVVVLTPLTIAVDLLTMPFEVIWICCTVGHGEPLMPWNGVERGRVD